ncbi:MAG: CPBP family intramembrane metalloprotease [Clostridia bacterium]|nr:CPBP family intramembrane metalloprotease [Clostridia bacterium]
MEIIKKSKQESFTVGLGILILLMGLLLPMYFMDNLAIGLLLYAVHVILVLIIGKRFYRIKINDGPTAKFFSILKKIVFLKVILIIPGILQFLIEAMIGTENVYEGIAYGGDLLSNIIQFILIIVLTPIIEETFFRGIFYKVLYLKLSEEAAAFITSVIFALLHPGAQLQIFVLSMFLFKYVREYNLKTAMFIHGGFNLIGMLAATFALM